MALAFIITSTTLAAAIGIVLVLNIQPGNFVDATSLSEVRVAHLTSPVPTGLPDAAELPEKVSGLIPKNPLASIASGEMLQVI